MKWTDRSRERALALCMVVVAFGVSSAIGQTGNRTKSENPPQRKGNVEDEVSAGTKSSKQVNAKQRQLERELEAKLTGAVFEGTWQMTGKAGLEGKAPLSEARSETYTIAKAAKTLDDHWVIEARIQYGDTDVTVPIPVRIVWAGDTPIITLDKLPIPGIGRYSARVMVFGNFYAGAWFGDGYGGVLSGRILRDEKPKSEADPKATSKRERAPSSP